MEKRITLVLVCCLVLAMGAPVSACYFADKDVYADDFVNALVDYCNHNEVRNMTFDDHDIDISNHDCRTYNVTRGENSLDFCFLGRGDYCVIVPLFLPSPWCYSFAGSMHVDNPQDGLKKPYTLTITDDGKKFTAVGKNWRLEARNTDCTRFKA